STVAVEAVLFYLVAYAAGDLGGFGAFSALSRGGRGPPAISDLAGLRAGHPGLPPPLPFFLVSLPAGPGAAGVLGKVSLFGAAVSAGRSGVVLAVVGVVMSVVSAYYYLRPVVHMYMRDPLGTDDWGRVAPGSALALAVSAAVVLVLGVYPAPVLALARQAAKSLL